MERRALVLALALTLPLALYGIPYTYAAVTSSAYVKSGVSNGAFQADVACNSGDYATGGGASMNPGHWVTSGPEVFDGVASYNFIYTGIPNAWGAQSNDRSATVWVVCQTPISVAGIGVPQFGSLYVAVALGAIIYFMMARRFAGRPVISPQS